MRIPIYEELILEQFTPEYLLEKLKASKVGMLPIYTSLHNVQESERAHAVSNIELTLSGLNKNPLFPYPFFIVSDTQINGTLMSVFSSVDELPSHYFKKSKRLKNKELLLLNKVGVLCEKVVNIELNNSLKIIKDSALEQRKLYKKTKELNFYEELTYLIQENKG